MLVLTSFSEGQPLVILEANAAGVPVIASDVGACRELLEGRSEPDRKLGPSGIVTRLAAPEETAAAITRLARDPRLRRRMGASGRRRVAAFYRKCATVSAYRALYMAGSWQESAGVSSA
jgi:glycosyltransferase involved in cell wall biosynthesis